MAIYNREDPRTALPQLEKMMDERIDTLAQKALMTPFKVQTMTLPSATYSATTTYWIYNDDVHPPAVDGYTAIGVLQGTPDSGGSALMVQVAILYEDYGDRFVGFIRNTSSSAQTTTILLPILYIRNDLLGD
jgi:hypothetical protein